MVKSSKVKLSFASPSEEGARAYSLYFMSLISYLGADLEFEFDVSVAKGEDPSDEDESSSEDDADADDEDTNEDADKAKDS